ncbi:MFS family permease [Kitasatospora sp. GAS204A]|uniref:MFS transporter n=1 Tax=Kitasatospora sp. GAS204B TaxID=3035283 RepID=UPI00247477E5|nr:MFS transporter [Kitasatospora sp. GAS204B]MDH6118166.1 MFS family permease [Kitasatospora sp. GAS204B]
MIPQGAAGAANRPDDTTIPTTNLATPVATPVTSPGDDDPCERTAAAEPAAPGTAASTRFTRPTGTFSSLRVRNYRYFFAGQIVSNTGSWMQRIAQDWLVLSLTGSPLAVGITTAMQFLPTLLLGLFGGVLADRMPKRRLLIVTQGAMGLLAAVLAVMTITGVVTEYHVYAFALLLGLVTVVDTPTRQAFVSEMVGPEHLSNAVSLNAANFQTARLVGPAVAGLLIAAVGSGWAFALNAVSFAAVIGGLLAMRTSELRPVERIPRQKGQLREGLHYVRERPDLMWPLVLAGFIGTFGFNFPTLLAGFAHETFHVGPGRYGLLNTAMALGSLAGALYAARRGNPRLRWLTGAALSFGVLEVLAAGAPGYWSFAVLLTLVGICGLTFNTAVNSYVQLATEPEMRGRVMGLLVLVFTGGTPVGAPLVGWATAAYGPRVGLLACGLVSALAAAVIGLVLARCADLRLRVDLHRGSGGRVVAFVPRQAQPAESPSRARERELAAAC